MIYFVPKLSSGPNYLHELGAALIDVVIGEVSGDKVRYGLGPYKKRYERKLFGLFSIGVAVHIKIHSLVIDLTILCAEEPLFFNRCASSNNNPPHFKLCWSFTILRSFPVFAVSQRKHRLGCGASLIILVINVGVGLEQSVDLLVLFVNVVVSIPTILARAIKGTPSDLTTKQYLLIQFQVEGEREVYVGSRVVFIWNDLAPKIQSDCPLCHPQINNYCYWFTIK
jgi:hypothetical protein